MSSCTCYAKIRFNRFFAPGMSQYWKAVKAALRAFYGLLRPVPLHHGIIRRLRYLRRPAAASGAWRLLFRSTAAEGGLAGCGSAPSAEQGEGVPLALWSKEADGDRLSPSARWLDLIGACSGAIRPATPASLKERLSVPTWSAFSLWAWGPAWGNT